MATRLLAGGLLLSSALLAWLSINVVIVARLMQAAIALSVVYVTYLAWRGWQVMRAALSTPAGDTDELSTDAGGLPFVSVVIPARDEASVIAGAVRDVVHQGYRQPDGTPRFELIVVDDASTDGTGAAAAEGLSDAEGAAPATRVVRREPGSGPATKGAAVAHGMPFCRGEVVAVVDADAQLEPDYLVRAMRAWTRDPSAVALQAQKRPQHEPATWLTEGQAVEQLMDLASQCGRWATDGTAELRGNGMFVRLSALERIGGWSTRALTEDLDLSTRLASVGDRITVAPEAVVVEEAVTGSGAFWRQRMRWAEGSLRRLMEHGPRMLIGPAPLGRKADFLAFTAEFLVPQLFLTTILASLATIPLPRPADWTVPASLFVGYGLGSFILAVAGLAAAGRRGGRILSGAVLGALFLSHWLLVVPAALLRIAVASRPSAYTKTPRTGRGR